MIPLITIDGSGRHQKLSDLIAEYNAIISENNSIKKIFLLHNMSYILETGAHDAKLIAWRDQLGKNGFEAHLQQYGIQRDGSALVKNIQFSAAVCKHSPQGQPSGLDYFASLRDRNALFQSNRTIEASLQNYIQYNHTILKSYETNQELQDTYVRSQYYLSLCYSKMEAIKGVVEQTFSDYTINSLGEKVGNNKNFILNVEGEDKKLVIRVEDRQEIANEVVLQTYPVSSYFSEDYYTMMMPFDVGLGLVEYRPVVLTEYLEKGGLDNYSDSLVGRSSADIVLETQRVFTLLSDFCIQLIESGHYHADIKLSNFLTDGQSIKVADRKNIINNPRPNGNEVNTTPTFAPPEFQKCITKFGKRVPSFQASTMSFDMPYFMSYELGMALKEFAFSALNVGVTEELFMKWLPSSYFWNPPNREHQNLMVLIQELTRINPRDRLSIEHFKILLPSLQKPKQAFMKQLEALSPKAKLQHSADRLQMESLLQADELTKELEETWDDIEARGVADELYSDPRLNVTAIAYKSIQQYLDKVGEFKQNAESKNASPLKALGSYLGINSSPIIRVEELPELPVLSEKNQRYFKILQSVAPNYLKPDEIAILEHVEQRQSRSFTPIAKTDSETEASLYDRSLRSTDTPENQNDSDSVTDDSFADSGSMIRVPVANEAEDQALDSGSLVRLPIQEKKLNSMQKRIIAGLRELRESDPSKNDRPTSIGVKDIDTTVKRGSGNFSQKK